jgi:asparagine synthase (glutamine-hydrolysing)
MCGIAGYVGKGDRHLVERMCQSLLHRGPDEGGFFVAPGSGVGMRRLSIIDLAGGHQPICNEDGSVIVVFNGEIYNYEELTASLKNRGHVFRTNSDTETIVHLYEDHGLEFVEHLRGMFAIALWDTRLRRLVLVRDRIGEKPLFYQHDQNDGSLLFGSEIKAILQRGDGRHVHAQALCQFMAAGYLSAPNTFYR